jgi:hypothetical protein
MESQLLVDEKCIEVLVSYNKSKRFEDIELESVEIVVAGSAINILPKLSEKQKQKIIDNLDYEI